MLFSRARKAIATQKRFLTNSTLNGVKLILNGSYPVVRDGKITSETMEPLMAGKTILIGVPAAFSPTCSEKHVPGFANNLDALEEMGIQRVLCITVADAFVLKAWADNLHIADKRFSFISDGNADFTVFFNLGLMMKDFFMGVRTCRFSSYLIDGVVQHMTTDLTGKFGDTSVERMIEYLGDPTKFKHANK